MCRRDSRAETRARAPARAASATAGPTALPPNPERRIEFTSLFPPCQSPDLVTLWPKITRNLVGRESAKGACSYTEHRKSGGSGSKEANDQHIMESENGCCSPWLQEAPSLGLMQGSRNHCFCTCWVQSQSAPASSVQTEAACLTILQIIYSVLLKTQF